MKPIQTFKIKLKNCNKKSTEETKNTEREFSTWKDN